MQDRIYSLKKDTLLRDTLKANLNTRLTEGRELKKIRDAHGEPRKIELNESCIRNLVNRERERERDGSRQGFVDKNEGPSKQKASITRIEKWIYRDGPTSQRITNSPPRRNVISTICMVSHCRSQSPGIDAEVNQTRERRADQSIEGRYTRDVDEKNAAFARSAGSIAGYSSADDGLSSRTADRWRCGRQSGVVLSARKDDNDGP